MNVVQDCVNTLQRIGRAVRVAFNIDSIPPRDLTNLPVQTANACGCGQDTCRLGAEGCKPQSITIQESEA